MKEITVEEHLVKRVKALGGVVRKVKWPGRRAAMDRVVLFPLGKIGWVELKRPGGKAEDHQVREHDLFRRMGQRVEVLDTKAAVDAFLEEFTDRRAM